MSVHLKTDVLRRFERGDMSDDEAAHVALHLDSCERCSASAAAFDPLASVFAQMPNPRVPPDLISAVLTDVRSPSLIERADLVVGVALLIAAATLLVVAGDPVAMGARFSVLGKTLWMGAGHALGGSAWVGGGVLLFSTIAACLAAVVLRLSRLQTVR